MEIRNYEELEDLYRKGNLHPADLKKETTLALDEILRPIRKHFDHGRAKELYDFVRRQEVTR